MKFSALGVILVLIGGLIPISIAQNQSNGQYLEEQSNESMAGELIAQLTKLGEFVESRIRPIKNELPQNTLENYKKAENLKEKASLEYQNGEYQNAIQDALLAMKYYREVLRELKETESTEMLREQLNEEAERVIAYFSYVEKVIKVAEKEGVNTDKLIKAYKETKDAYRTVFEALKAKKIEDAKRNMEIARMKRAELNRELEKVLRELASRNAERIVNSFLVKTNQSIAVAEVMVKNAKTRGMNVEEAEQSIERIKNIYIKVESLAKEGKWIEALGIIRENSHQIQKFLGMIERVRRESMNIKETLEELRERIKKDTTAIAILKKKGINTARAEAQLKGAVNELSVAIISLKRNDISNAVVHIQRAEKLLAEVEEFIKANS
ncbi:DNA double-strand break repair Rad50 ATPase [Thermococcus sp. 2319x1]|uniref:hypothetical protein n=1 Tax=Thermococcus sp. 2319x1 TaxID=1674923 RepID=UPI00073AD642|nr:hypothetical protein [Thermococcus sp. 2319x1]ALV61754.1 DNA double-strand break repair Rad50 ATPase [Thermococcus sp. 2319x1]